MSRNGRVEVGINVPPPTKRRAERVAEFLAATVTSAIEENLAIQDEHVLGKLPTPELKQTYLRKRLRERLAFPNRKKRNNSYPDPAEGPHVTLRADVAPQSKEMLDRLCVYYAWPQGLLIARIFKRLENYILREMLTSDEERAQFLAGKWKRPGPPLLKIVEDADEQEETAGDAA